MSSLSPFFLEKARKELGEDEKRKEQAVERLREYLTKHSFIKFYGLDDTFLLYFLRGRKYQMTRVFEAVDEFSVYLKNRPQWYHVADNEVENFLDNCRNGICLHKYRDADGRRIVVQKNLMMELLKVSPDECYRIVALTINGLIHEPETQIAGLIYIYDLRDVSWEFAKKFPPNIFVDFLASLKVAPVRVKKLIIIGLPSFAVTIADFVLSVMSKKLRKRVTMVKELKEVSKIIDTTKLLNSDGTDYVYENFEYIDDLIRKGIQSINAFDVEFDKIKKFENSGNFRTLEVD